jgi:hypothetical protein
LRQELLGGGSERLDLGEARRRNPLMERNSQHSCDSRAGDRARGLRMSDGVLRSGVSLYFFQGCGEGFFEFKRLGPIGKLTRRHEAQNARQVAS